MENIYIYLKLVKTNLKLDKLILFQLTDKGKISHLL